MIIGQKKAFPASRILWILALVLLVIILGAGPGVHLGFWTPFEGFMFSLWAGFFGGLSIAGLAVAVIIILFMSPGKAGIGITVLSLVIGLGLAAPVSYLRLSGGGGVVPIHDITTNMDSPPEFMVLVGKRGKGANSLIYNPQRLVDLQKKAYPDIKPLLTPVAADKAFSRALKVAEAMGWTVTGIDARARRFEATDHSFWFNFADDIVVVIKKTTNGSRIDMRSISRVGVSDLGVNADRIRNFQKKFIQAS
ncbi:MAG: DUF1499 domain-containing protein [Alphaproteobacteria bacterium]|nr:DUF1499 domain-containing protein [Alphaproteobacteria bacterium]